MLFVFPSRADFEAEELAWRLRRENGVRWLELSADELRQREPALDRRYTFGLLVEENGQCRDPGAYVAALVRHAQSLGADAATGQAQPAFASTAAGCARCGRRPGEIACDKAVIAAGAWSQTLAAAAGDRVPLETERGYHAVITDPGIAPRYPMMPSDGKMAA